MRAMTHFFRTSGGRCRKLRLDLAGGDEFVHGSVLHGLLGREDEVAVGTFDTFSSGCPVCLAMISFISSRLRTISLAWISMSTAWPAAPP